MNATAKRYLIEAFAWFALAIGFLVFIGCQKTPEPTPPPDPTKAERTAYSPIVAVAAAEAAMPAANATPAPLPPPPAPDSGANPMNTEPAGTAADTRPTGPTTAANGVADTGGREADQKQSGCAGGQCGYTYQRRGIVRRLLGR